jgi:tRNA-2-methylthio-N6-dimethylallyladenosine synthase
VNYHIWTIGCQMNVAESERLARALAARGLTHTVSPTDSDLIVLNTCSVRQAAEEKALSKAGTLATIKRERPETLIAVGGCMVGPDTLPTLKRRFPFIDLFFRPGFFTDLLVEVDSRLEAGGGLHPHGPIAPSPATDGPGPCRWLPVMNGCNRRCAYCIVPYRRGRERSRPSADVVAEARVLVGEGARDITLLGQIVDRYGHDLDEPTDLAELLTMVSDVDGVERLRFLTSHPKDLSDRLIDAMASLPKVCPHLNLPIQSGDDQVLRKMKRGYTVAQYLDVLGQVRAAVPGLSVATDVIVGFSGETDEQFERTLALLEDARFDVVHVAMYSPRPGTLAADTMPDDVSSDAKHDRLRAVEDLQQRVATGINAALLGQSLEVLVDGRDESRERWRGRTPTNKLVFFDQPANEQPADCYGQLVHVRIDHTSPWSLQGQLERSAERSRRRMATG